MLMNTAKTLNMWCTHVLLSYVLQISYTCMPCFSHIYFLCLVQMLIIRNSHIHIFFFGSHCGHDSMVVGFTTICAISAYQHLSWELESHSWQGVLDRTLNDKVCQ
jgi:hypothetical protein